MLFCLICTDKPNALDLRLANRDAHLKYWGEAGLRENRRAVHE